MQKLLEMLNEYRRLDERNRNGEDLQRHELFRLRDLRTELDNHFKKNPRSSDTLASPLSVQERRAFRSNTSKERLPQTASELPKILATLPPELLRLLQDLKDLEGIRRQRTLGHEEEERFCGLMDSLFSRIPRATLTSFPQSPVPHHIESYLHIPGPLPTNPSHINREDSFTGLDTLQSKRILQKKLPGTDSYGTYPSPDEDRSTRLTPQVRLEDVHRPQFQNLHQSPVIQTNAYPSVIPLNNPRASIKSEPTGEWPSSKEDYDALSELHPPEALSSTSLESSRRVDEDEYDPFEDESPFLAVPNGKTDRFATNHGEHRSPHKSTPKK